MKRMLLLLISFRISSCQQSPVLDDNIQNLISNAIGMNLIPDLLDLSLSNEKLISLYYLPLSDVIKHPPEDITLGDMINMAYAKT